MTSNAKLYGLVLSGGKSTRMGKDKGLIEYHGIPQREYLYDLLNEVCEQTFLSVREEQEPEVPSKIRSIVDLNEYQGPYNGLLSAYRKYPDVAWFVLACDLPFIGLGELKMLISNRDTSKQATTFALSADPLPEPLCAIWEPHALRSSIEYLATGVNMSPRKFLMDCDTKLVFPQNENVLWNANSEEEYRTVLDKLTS